MGDKLSRSDDLRYNALAELTELKRYRNVGSGIRIEFECESVRDRSALALAQSRATRLRTPHRSCSLLFQTAGLVQPTLKRS